MRKPSGKKKPNYRGPYQDNPDLGIQTIRKSMRPESDGPTVDTFSNIDTTTNFGLNETNPAKTTPRRKRPTKEKKRSVSFENILIYIFGLIATGVGIIVYTHSNKFVSVEKDIEYIKDDTKEQKQQIETVSKQTNEIDKKIDLLDQKVNITSSRK